MTIPYGLSAFPITPADRHGHVDDAALRALIARLVRAGVDSIGLLGSTGSYMYLTRAERRRAIETTLSETGGTTPLLVGIGALRTDEAIHHAQDAKALHATAGLLAPVSYAPLTQDEVFEHFTTVARAGGLPIVIYDNPGTTGFHFTPDLLARLAAEPGIIGIKTAAPDSGAADHLAVQRALFPSGFSIGCSRDWTTTEMMIAGADTWYSVLGGIMPEVAMAIISAIRRGDADAACELDALLAPLWTLFREHSGLRVAYALNSLLDVCDVEPPRPVLSLPDLVWEQVATVLTNLREHASLLPSDRRIVA